MGQDNYVVKKNDVAIGPDSGSGNDVPREMNFCHGSTDPVNNSKTSFLNLMPLMFTLKNLKAEVKENCTVIGRGKTEEAIRDNQLSSDWLLGIILMYAFVFTFIRAASKDISSGFLRFILLRGINDPSNRDYNGLFQWQSTLYNLISFSVIGLFAYHVVIYYNEIPEKLSGILLWLALVCLIIAVITLRHFLCLVTGTLSGKREVFVEYLISVYNSYRYAATILFFLVILVSYTIFFPAKVYFFSGIATITIVYLIRIIRLIIIFIRGNISIFYLILYLCALEILPVVISVKYFTGVVYIGV
jgi:hypothetical protein